MNGKKKLISKITALLLALLLTNHFVFQAYASGETEVVVTESVAEAVADESEAPAAEAVEAEEPAEAPTADIPAAVDEMSSAAYSLWRSFEHSAIPCVKTCQAAQSML